MKENELRKHATCSLCNQPIGPPRSIAFWTIEIERHAIITSTVTIRTRSSDAEVTYALLAPITLTVCNACAFDSEIRLTRLAEQRTA